MSSIHSNNYNFTTHIKNISNDDNITLNPNSLLSVLSGMKNAKIYNSIVEKAGYSKFLNDKNANVTLLIRLDSSIPELHDISTVDSINIIESVC